MGRLIYCALASLDGYVSDAEGDFSWAEPAEDVHWFINALAERQSLVLYGRRMYETMAVWEGLPQIERYPDYVRDFARVWKATRKIVFSSSLETVTTADTTLARRLDQEEITRLKREEAGSIGIGGADLASQALGLGLLDDLVLFLHPVVVGKGKKWLGADAAVHLVKRETREFKNGVVMLHYAIEPRETARGTQSLRKGGR